MKETTSRRAAQCPKCSAIYTAPPAISRDDGHTLICPECGTREALKSIGCQPRSRAKSSTSFTAATKGKIHMIAAKSLCRIFFCNRLQFRHFRVNMDTPKGNTHQAGGKEYVDKRCNRNTEQQRRHDIGELLGETLRERKPVRN